MIFTHYPEVHHSQLLEHPVGPEEYLDLPYLRGSYFAIGLLPIDGLRRVTKVHDRISLKLHLPEGLSLSGTLMSPEGEKFENRILIQRKEDGFDFRATFPDKGKWVVRLFAGQGGSGSMEGVAEFGFDAEQGTEDVFPRLDTPFFDNQAAVLSQTLDF